MSALRRAVRHALAATENGAGAGPCVAAAVFKRPRIAGRTDEGKVHVRDAPFRA